jgi:hypothetical protein
MSLLLLERQAPVALFSTKKRNEGKSFHSRNQFQVLGRSDNPPHGAGIGTRAPFTCFRPASIGLNHPNKSDKAASAGSIVGFRLA